MDYFQLGYTALGGLGIFFLGMKFLSEGLQRIAGDLIQRMINAVTSNRVIAVLVGLSITTIVQSSSVTTVMVVGLVNAGLMNLTQAIGVVFGANIGTTITGWILAVRIGKYGLLMIGLGIFPMLFAKSARWSALGKTLVALGLVFFGLEIMSGAFKPLRNDEGFLAYMQMFHAQTLLSVVGCVLMGCALTFVVQSSSAMLGITIALALTGSISFQTAVALVLGENIGTTVTAQLAAIGANVSAKRTALSHTLFNVIGVGVMLFVFQPYLHLIDALVPGSPSQLGPDGSYVNVAAHIAMAHTVFNTTAVLVMLPFLTPFSRLVERILPAPAIKEARHLQFIGNPVIEAPAVSLTMARRELVNMARLVEKIIRLSQEYCSPGATKEDVLTEIARLEGITDSIQQEITTFVCLTMEGSLSLDQSEQAYSLIRAADELESIADYGFSLCRYRKRMETNNLEFSESAWSDVREYLSAVGGFFEMIYRHLTGAASHTMREVRDEAVKLNISADKLRDRHLERMGSGVCAPLPALTFSDMVVALRRIKNHSVNLFEAITFQADEQPSPTERAAAG